MPAEIDAVGSMVLYDRRDVVQDHGVLDARGRLLPDVQAQVGASSRPQVVEVVDGGWRCVASGKSTITLVAGDVEKPVEVSCLLVDRVVVTPQAVDVILETEDGVVVESQVEPLSVAVVDPENVPLDVPVRVTSRDDRIVRVGAHDVLELRAFGATVVDVTAGEVVVEVPVRVGVVEREGPLAIPEYGSEEIPLAPGRWRWVVSSQQGVAVHAGDCRDMGFEIDRTCVIDEHTTLSLGAPTPDIKRLALRLERLPELSTP